MDGLLVVILLVLFFLLLNIKKSVSEKFKTLQDKIDLLSAELKKARSSPQQPETKKSVFEDEQVQRAFAKPSPIVSSEPEKKVPEVKKEEVKKKKKRW